MTPQVTGRTRPHRRTALLLAALLLTVLTVLTGCSRPAGDDNGVATADGKGSASPSTAPSGRGDALEFAQCMRENGIKDWPDPSEDGNTGVMPMPEGADPQAVEAATEKCRKYLPNGGERPKSDPEQAEQLRRFAQCMRDNGVPEYPDPEGDGPLAFRPGSGIDPSSPDFRAAEDKCKKLMPQPSNSAVPNRRAG
jgi:hypothetical protein